MKGVIFLSCDTKSMLADSLKLLMAKKAFAKISVGEICEQSGINRKSFYYHFKDKFQLLDWSFESEIALCFKTANPNALKEKIYVLCEYLYSNKAFYKAAFEVKGQNSFPEGFEAFCKNLISPAEHADFKAAAVRSMVELWLKDTKDVMPKQMVSLLISTID